jgi:hypothetical protein
MRMGISVVRDEEILPDCDAPLPSARALQAKRLRTAGS